MFSARDSMIRHHGCIVYLPLFHGPVTHAPSAIKELFGRHSATAKVAVLRATAYSDPTVFEEWTDKGIGVGGSRRNVSDSGWTRASATVCSAAEHKHWFDSCSDGWRRACTAREVRQPGSLRSRKMRPGATFVTLFEMAARWIVHLQRQKHARTIVIN